MRPSCVICVLLCFVLASGFVFPVNQVFAQSTYSTRTLQASVGNGGPAGSGTLTLAAAGATFNSPDFVFALPADDINAVEFSGTRDAFLTLVLTQTSKFPRAYPSLVRTRFNSIGQAEQMLVVSLQPGQPVEPATVSAKQFQGFIRAHRAERDQAAVGVTGSDAVHPSFGKILHVALRNTDGLLTFFPDHMQYDNPDVSIRFPLGDVLSIEAAGARETFMHVHVRLDSPLQKGYLPYEELQYTPQKDRYFTFVLLPLEPVGPAFRLAQDYADYVGNLRAGRERASVEGEASSLPAQAPAAVASGAAPSGKREIARLDAAFLERHNPSNKLVNSFKAIMGVSGTLIVFDTGLGYVSQNQPSNLRPARLPYLEGGYLKFFVPSEAVSSVRDVSVIRNANGSDTNNTFIAQVELDRNSPFYLQHRALMADSDQDNRLFFVFKSRYLLTEFLRNAPHAAAARDQF